MPITRITIGRYEEEVTHPGALKAALAEFISTLIFVFAGEGSGMAFSKLTAGAANTPAGLISAAIAHAFALFVAVSVAANISGGHVNPAVTFGAFVGGNISLLRGILYWIAQLLGSIVACLLLRFSTGGLTTSAFALSAGEGVWNAFVFEIVMTFGLVYTRKRGVGDLSDSAPKREKEGYNLSFTVGLSNACGRVTTITGSDSIGESLLVIMTRELLTYFLKIETTFSILNSKISIDELSILFLTKNLRPRSRNTHKIWMDFPHGQYHIKVEVDDVAKEDGRGNTSDERDAAEGGRGRGRLCEKDWRRDSRQWYVEEPEEGAAAVEEIRSSRGSGTWRS
ncbi:hypothetical protein Scep_005220 [Stephania cephalantha]|uniref:Uncharacterized protein n=1 Tax=Stephania cephalantha TaxID=152367 RepID=A0AAP0KTW9_9MAGN